MQPFNREILVEEAEMRLVRLRLVTPFETSFGRFEEEEHIILRLAGEGEKGWGEVPLHGAPFFSHEDIHTAWHVLADILLPGTAGRAFCDAARLAEVGRMVRGHPSAKAGLELAFHDLQARLAGEPLWRHYGGTRRSLPVGISLGIERSIERLAEKVTRAHEAGYRRIKLKIRPGWDSGPVNRIRALFPDIPLTVDANGAYTPADGKIFKELDRFNLAYIEQPLAYDDLLDHSRLQAELATSICLDESIESVRAARAALELKACRVVNIKPTRVGGFLAAREIHDLCRRAGVPVWCGGRLETGIGRLHNLAIATLPGFSLPGDISPSSRYYEEDLVDPPVVMEGGMVTPPAGPGLGHRVREDRLEEVTLTRRLFREGGEAAE